jgi:hypothetical protein
MGVGKKNMLKLKKLWFKIPHAKMMLIIFWDKQYVQQELHPKGQPINAAHHRDSTEQPLKRINHMWPALCQSGDWLLLQDTAPLPNTVTETQYLANRHVAVLQHIPYLPGLIHAKYFLFPKLRFSLKGQHFQSIMEFQNAVTRKLTSNQKEAFLESIKNYMNMQISV